MQQNHPAVRTASGDAGALKGTVLRALLRRLNQCFVDADKEDYDKVDVTRERARSFSIPGCSFEYVSIDLQRWMLDALIEFRLYEHSLDEIFGELELAQIRAAYDGPATSGTALETIRSYCDSDTEYREYLNGLFFLYNTHQNPFRRLEVLIVHLLTTGTIPCYNSQAIFLKHTSRAP